jgi:hypothetical protein
MPTPLSRRRCAANDEETSTLFAVVDDGDERAQLRPLPGSIHTCRVPI